jgi:hypothetical protein
MSDTLDRVYDRTSEIIGGVNLPLIAMDDFLVRCRNSIQHKLKRTLSDDEAEDYIGK